MSNSCKVDGCIKLGKLTKGKRYFERGYCGMHYQRYMKGKPLEGKCSREPRPAIIEGDVAKIPLGVNAKKGYEIVDKEFAWIDQYNWTSNQSAGGYAVAWVNGKDTRMHHLIIEQSPPLVTDHINHNRLDNRMSNLRLVSIQQNAMNSKARSAHGYKGVISYKGRWKSSITFNNKRIQGGIYDTIEEAAESYNELARKYFGEYAKLNSIKRLKEGL